MGDLGEEAYNAYRDAVDCRGPITGEELPPFSELPRRIQDAWRAAAQRVAKTKAYPHTDERILFYETHKQNLELRYLELEVEQKALENEELRQRINK